MTGASRTSTEASRHRWPPPACRWPPCRRWSWPAGSASGCVADEPQRDPGSGQVSRRPSIGAGVAAEILNAAPSRVRKRFDANPKMAEHWTWERDSDAWVVRAEAETVRIVPVTGTVRAADQLSCSCLLGPRCVHLLAVAAALDPTDDPEGVGPPPAPAPDQADRPQPGPGWPPTDAPPATPAELSRRQRDAVPLAWRAGARLLTIGASAATATARGDLLLAAHACQEAGRRRYHPIGSLHLHGLASEAVVASSGYAGTVVWLVDQAGRLWTVGDVAPGEPARAAEAYRSPVRFGQLGLQHADLSRSRVIAQGAPGSTDGRLGSGSGVTATRVGASSWDDPPLVARWEDPVEQQLERVWQALEVPVGERPAGADLLFLDSIVLGPAPDGLALQARNALRPLDLLGVVPSEHAELAYLDNLRRLGGLAGHPLRLIGRVRLDRPR